MTTILIYSQFLFLGAILVLLPNITRRGLLFAVPVAANFRETPEARRAIRIFRWIVGIATALGLLVLSLLPIAANNAMAVCGLIAVTAVAYYKANRLVAPFAVSGDGTRSLVLSELPERLPGFIWLSAGPFVLLTLAAVFINYHRASIPAKIPAHWGIDGAPDRWAARSIRSVYGPLFLGAELCAWFTVSSLASWYGARRSSLRPAILAVLIAAQYGLAALFATLALQPLLAIPIWAPLAGSLLLLVTFIAFAINKSAGPSDPPERTQDECWKAGVFYYNPNDPVVFLEKRGGLGYTMNFANPWSWVLLAGLALVIATTPLVLA